jgi:hypothetical protein
MLVVEHAQGGHAEPVGDAWSLHGVLEEGNVGFVVLDEVGKVEHPLRIGLELLLAVSAAMPANERMGYSCIGEERLYGPELPGAHGDLMALAFETPDHVLEEVYLRRV